MGSNRNIFIIALFLFSVRPNGIAGQNKDSLFFARLKQFYFRECGKDLNPKLFAVKAPRSNVPFQYVYVSRRQNVANALKEAYVYCAQDSKQAAKTAKRYRKEGKSAFVYRSFGTSDAQITDNLLKYAGESKAFVVFHELTHNYFLEKKIKIKYHLNEAACDVLGIKLSEKLMKEEQGLLDSAKFAKMRYSIHEVYKALLEATEKIATDTAHCAEFCREAEKKIKQCIKGADVFLQDRFNYPVSPAFILKNLYYCQYYFRLRDIYQKSSNFEEFIQSILAFNEQLK